MAFPRRFAVLSALSVLLSSLSAQTTDPAHTATTKAATPSITAVSDCHPHGTVQFVFP
jgi:zinc transporter 1/2/3